jgi:hypothetical protein
MHSAVKFKARGREGRAVGCSVVGCVVVGRLVGRLVGYLVGCRVGRLFGLIVGRLVERAVGRIEGSGGVCGCGKASVDFEGGVSRGFEGLAMTVDSFVIDDQEDGGDEDEAAEDDGSETSFAVNPSAVMSHMTLLKRRVGATIVHRAQALRKCPTCAPRHGSSTLSRRLIGQLPPCTSVVEGREHGEGRGLFGFWSSSLNFS